MSSSLDQALGDIISANRSKGGNNSRRGGGRSGGGDRKEGGGSGPIRRGGNRRDDRREQRNNDQYSRPAGRSDGAWQRDLGSNAASSSSSHQQQVQRIVGDTVRVSNLDSKITEGDLRYVFDKIGPLNSVSIHYTSTGQCTGTAEVRFTSNSDAAEAVSQLDQAEVDGRIMYVQLVGHVMQASLPSVKRRDDRRSDNNGPSRGDRDRSRNGRQQQQGGNRDGNNNRDGNRRQDRQQGEGNRGQGGKRGGRGGRAERPAASMEDLDAELNSYHEARAASSAAASEAPAAASSSEAAPAAE